MEEYERRRKSVEEKKEWVEENLQKMSPTEVVFCAGLLLRKVTRESKSINPYDEAIDWAIVFAEFCDGHPETWPTTIDEGLFQKKSKVPPNIDP